MKVHGPIEALPIGPEVRTNNASSPWMKVHGPIEAVDCKVTWPNSGNSPWMKVHGPIEAVAVR